MKLKNEKKKAPSVKGTVHTNLYVSRKFILA